MRLERYFLAFFAFIFPVYSNPRVHHSKKELPAETLQQVLLLQAKEAIKAEVGI